VKLNVSSSSFVRRRRKDGVGDEEVSGSCRTVSRLFRLSRSAGTYQYEVYGILITELSFRRVPRRRVFIRSNSEKGAISRVRDGNGCDRNCAIVSEESQEAIMGALTACLVS
jgi:hypothetical protein